MFRFQVRRVPNRTHSRMTYEARPIGATWGEETGGAWLRITKAKYLALVGRPETEVLG